MKVDLQIHLSGEDNRKSCGTNGTVWADVRIGFKVFVTFALRMAYLTGLDVKALNVTRIE